MFADDILLFFRPQPTELFAGSVTGSVGSNLSVLVDDLGLQIDVKLEKHKQCLSCHFSYR